jgi:hypothetical protein
MNGKTKQASWLCWSVELFRNIETEHGTHRASTEFTEKKSWSSVDSVLAP